MNSSQKQKTIMYSILSGTSLGLAAFFIKIAVSGAGLQSIISNPFTWIAAILGIIGFILLQKSLYSGFISEAVPIMAGISILLPIILASMFLGEILEGKYIAIFLIAIGVFVLSFSGKSNSIK